MGAEEGARARGGGGNEKRRERRKKKTLGYDTLSKKFVRTSLWYMFRPIRTYPPLSLSSPYIHTSHKSKHSLKETIKKSKKRVLFFN